MYQRILTVSGASQYMDLYGRYVKVPFVKLQGKWVQKLGFTVGSKVLVLKGDGEITIKLLKEETR
jgi:hypothetical protein